MDLILILIIILVPLIAQIKIKSSYSKYSEITNKNNLTGYDVARKILDENGLDNIYIVETRGELTDHYDPTQKVVRLSSNIYHSNSIAAAAVAAHECGHAIQHKEKYSFLTFRTAIYPVVNIATSISYWIIMLGFFLEVIDMVYVGIALTCIGLLFQIITLPVEFDASKRAGVQLQKYGLIYSDEYSGVKNMLGSAAMTYVAGVLASLLQIIRLVLIANNRRK